VIDTAKEGGLGWHSTVAFRSMKLLFIVLGAVLLSGCAFVEPQPDQQFSEGMSYYLRSKAFCRDFLQAVMSPDPSDYVEYVTGREMKDYTWGEIFLPHKRHARDLTVAVVLAERRELHARSVTLTYLGHLNGQIPTSDDPCERASIIMGAGGSIQGYSQNRPTVGAEESDTSFGAKESGTSSGFLGRGFLGPYSPNTYGPGINSDATGRPFIWQPDFGGPALGPIRPNVYGPGIGSDATGRPVRPACPPGWVGPC
jgi:hypothetical protein